MGCYSTTYLSPPGRTLFLSCPCLAVVRGTLRGRVPPSQFDVLPTAGASRPRPPHAGLRTDDAKGTAAGACACSRGRPELEAAQNGAVEVVLAHGSAGP